MHEKDRDKLCFSVPGLGIFTWRTVPQGLAVAPAAFCATSIKMLDRAGITYNPGDAPRDGDGDGLLPCRLVAMLHGRAKISHRVDVEGRVARITPSHESDLGRTLLV